MQTCFFCIHIHGLIHLFALHLVVGESIFQYEFRFLFLVDSIGSQELMGSGPLESIVRHLPRKLGRWKLNCHVAMVTSLTHPHTQTDTHTHTHKCQTDHKHTSKRGSWSSSWRSSGSVSLPIFPPSSDPRFAT